MKKSILLAITLIAGLLTSCDMEKFPVGTINSTDAFRNVSDAASFRNQFYIGMRALSSSGFFSSPELQMDMFNGLTINGNNGGTFANGTIVSANTDIEGYWSALYSYIGNCNFFIEGVEPLLAKAREHGNEQEIVAYELYLGEAHFARGYYYGEMFDRWCQVYSPEKGDTPHLGLPIVTKYAPSADRDSYPARNTMNETLAQIKADLEYALAAILDYETIDDSQLKPMATYLSSNAVKAFQARLALWTGDYTTAYNKATEVINSTVYSLSPRSEYTAMWTDDVNSEIIFLPYESASELSGAYGAAWLTSEETLIYYIPTSTTIALLGEAGKDLRGQKDIRYNAFLSNRELQTEAGNIKSPAFVKFPGNPELQTGSTNNLRNRPKTFRLGELYLIAAEAAQLSGDATNANLYLNKIRAARINGWSDQEYQGNDLRDQIRKERTKELLGEGFRMSDLRRWKQGFDRRSGADYPSTWPDIAKILTPAGLNVSYSSDDYRYTWPIPSGEFNSNPQIAGQQNPGY